MVNGHRAPESLRGALEQADASHRALVTLIDGRFAVILPRRDYMDEEAAEHIKGVLEALAAAGFAPFFSGNAS